jgi:uncharacterized small protein (DUF1192 family)
MKLKDSAILKSDLILHSHMYPAEIISTQIPIPASMYDAIVDRAQTQGHSVTNEILDLLSTSLDMGTLNQEIARWEAASDEDWLNLETSLTSEVI